MQPVSVARNRRHLVRARQAQPLEEQFFLARRHRVGIAEGAVLISAISHSRRIRLLGAALAHLHDDRVLSRRALLGLYEPVIGQGIDIGLPAQVANLALSRLQAGVRVVVLKNRLLDLAPALGVVRGGMQLAALGQQVERSPNGLAGYLIEKRADCFL